MIVPSIDLEAGRCVQLIGGETLAVDAGDPAPLAASFGPVGEVALIDLDAAKGSGENRALIRSLLPHIRARVGGGIRDVASARQWLDLGASKVILGTAARPEILSQLPKERVIASVDSRNGEVVVEGWRRGTGVSLEQRMGELRPYVGGFLLTLVENEGQRTGVDLRRAEALRRLAGEVPITLAGGVARAEEVGALDRMGIDAQVGMALYRGDFTLADALWSCLRSDRPDGLVPTVVCDEQGRALGLVHSSLASLTAMLQEGVGVYHSRRRGLWRKGETSGAVQRLVSVAADCDRDALLVRVEQSGPGFCHRGTYGCFGAARGLAGLEATLRQRLASPPEQSYTARLAGDPVLLAAKLVEEAGELAAATGQRRAVEEAADVLYFSLLKLLLEGASMDDAEAELDRRALVLTRRGGEAKQPLGGAE